MSSISEKSRDFVDIAEKYSQLNDNCQLGSGKNLFSSLNIKHGETLNVLDMGCGTGELTAFIADSLGPNSQVVGVDPDLERINKATREQNRHRNLVFIHGDSSSEFPHFNEEYYDVHFSNFVINWLNPQEKEEFIKTAFRCLKPGGRIAILSLGAEISVKILRASFDLLVDDGMESNKPPGGQHLVAKSEIERMLEKAGFDTISNKYTPVTSVFENMDQYLHWVYATFYIHESQMSSSKKADFVKRFTNEDGTVTLDMPVVYQVIAMKAR